MREENVSCSTSYRESHLPHGGRAGSASGVGRANGQYSMQAAFTELKTVILDVWGGR
jgi:succinate-semialdehyde dehydrogenase/glutarate-semialdehyde dehydrogenase